MLGRNKGNVKDEAWNGRTYKRGKEGGVRNEEGWKNIVQM